MRGLALSVSKRAASGRSCASSRHCDMMGKRRTQARHGVDLRPLDDWGWGDGLQELVEGVLRRVR